jgi:DNA-binding response OmpR family regulator
VLSIRGLAVYKNDIIESIRCPMKILIIEDEAKLAEYLRKGLGSAGLASDIANDGLTGLHMALEFDYAAIILDSMLPGLDGLGVLAALRQRKQTPVLMLTALGKVEDRVKGLQSGADDYLVKPFAFSELTARIQVLLRRSSPTNADTQSNLLCLEGLEMDLGRRRVSRNGSALTSSKEFQLLSLFLRRKGEVLSRAEIAEQVWDMNFDSNTNVVEVAIKRLRGKIDTPFSSPCCIPSVEWDTF